MMMGHGMGGGGVLDQVTGTIDQVHGTVEQVQGAVDQVQGTIDNANSTVEQVGGFFGQGGEPMASDPVAANPPAAAGGGDQLNGTVVLVGPNGPQVVQVPAGQTPVIVLPDAAPFASYNQPPALVGPQ